MSAGRRICLYVSVTHTHTHTEITHTRTYLAEVHEEGAVPVEQHVQRAPPLLAVPLEASQSVRAVAQRGAQHVPQHRAASDNTWAWQRGVRGPARHGTSGMCSVRAHTRSGGSS